MSHISRIFLLILIISSIVLPVIATAGSSHAPPLPNVHILATGGTIAGISPESTDMINYQPGNLGVASLIAAVPEVHQYASVTGEQVCNINSDDITPEIWLNLSSRINTLLSDPDIDGIVVTHGTDTLEETAYFLNLVIHCEKPVVVTGAMRPATAISADGPLNLLNAVQLAGSKDARGAGVLILLNGEINSARETTKMNTGSVETFRSPDFGLLGYMAEGRPALYRLPVRNHTLRSEFNVTGLSTLPRVDIVSVYPGMDATAIDAFVRKGTQGLVIASMGNGEYPATIHRALRSAESRGIPIVLSSRTGTGITNARDDHFISADTLSPQKARILLMLALTKTRDRSRIAEMFRIY